MITKEVIQGFLDETSTLLVDMAASTHQTTNPANCREALKNIERGLHTITGNAAAFGYTEFAEAARQFLEWLRSTRPAGSKSFDGPQDTSRILAFLRRSRDLLDLVKGGGTPGKAFFAEITDSLRRTQIERLPSRQEAAAVDSGRSVARNALESDAERILAKAPPVQPRIDALIRVAIKKLHQTAKRSSGPPQDQPPSTPRLAPATSPGIDDRDRGATAREETAVRCQAPLPPVVGTAPHAADASFPHGYAFEASLTVESILNLTRKCKPDQRLGALFWRVSQILTSISQWSAAVRKAPLLDFLNEAVSWVERRSGGASVELKVDAADPAGVGFPDGRGEVDVARELARRQASRPLSPGILVLPGKRDDVGHLLEESERLDRPEADHGLRVGLDERGERGCRLFVRPDA